VSEQLDPTERHEAGKVAAINRLQVGRQQIAVDQPANAEPGMIGADEIVDSSDRDFADDESPSARPAMWWVGSFSATRSARILLAVTPAVDGTKVIPRPVAAAKNQTASARKIHADRH
jgi:hypothetical protein